MGQLETSKVEKYEDVENIISDRIEKIDVYPNPAINIVHVICSDPNVHSFELRSLNGNVIDTFSSRNEDIVLQISNLDTGMYVILGKTIEGEIVYQKRWIKN